jgi:hypothetical protein
MKFDASRVESLLRELLDPRYVGPDGEAQLAEFIAGQFAKLGLEVERREVRGSGFPRRAAPWVGWLGYGTLITSVYGLALLGDGFFAVLVWLLSLYCAPWINAVVRNRIRPGRQRPPLGSAPVLIASRPGRPAASMRVVLQSVISGVEADPFQFSIRGPILSLVVYGLLYLFPPGWGSAFLLCRAGFFLNPGRLHLLMASEILTRYVYPAFLAPVWIGILLLLSREYRHRRAMAGRDRPDRRGLALLLEMARSWPRDGSRSIEPVFVAAGGQSLDYAGSREVLRLLDPERSATPCLLILFFEPGAGEELLLGTIDPSTRGLADLAEAAARSLWIPCRRDEDILESLWPFQGYFSALALIGSDRRAFGDDSTDPRALHRAAQLATEIALRWAREQEQGGIRESAD